MESTALVKVLGIALRESSQAGSDVICVHCSCALLQKKPKKSKHVLHS